MGVFSNFGPFEFVPQYLVRPLDFPEFPTILSRRFRSGADFGWREENALRQCFSTHWRSPDGRRPPGETAAVSVCYKPHLNQ